MKRLIPFVLVLVVGVAVLVLATSGGASKTKPATASTAKPVVAVRGTPLGKILVDAQGRTLYVFEADKPNVSNCSGACRSVWPPLTSGSAPTAARGALGARLAIVAVGGRLQVTYNGHPLYFYAGDTKPGDTTGQGLNQFGADWYVLAPTGDKIDKG
jgi:predicted lipoprotein with Yx(FWY)xxD motif